MITKVAVIGSGTMGSGIAHCFAQKGFEVSLIDISEEALKKALVNIDKNLDRMEKKQLIINARYGSIQLNSSSL